MEANMTDPTVRTIWSKSQQIELERLVALKKQVIEENTDKIRQFLLVTQWSREIEITDWMMDNAEGLRDLLEPFDERTRK